MTEDLIRKKDLFSRFLFKKLKRRGFNVNYDSNDEPYFVVDVDKVNYKKVCKILPEEFEGIRIDVRQIASSRLLRRGKGIISFPSSIRNFIGLNLKIDVNRHNL